MLYVSFVRKDIFSRPLHHCLFVSPILFYLSPPPQVIKTLNPDDFFVFSGLGWGGFQVGVFFDVGHEHCLLIWDIVAQSFLLPSGVHQIFFFALPMLVVLLRQLQILPSLFQSWKYVYPFSPFLSLFYYFFQDAIE